MAKVNKQERDEAIAKLRGMLKPGDKVYTILRHRSSSGMSRVIDMVVARDGGKIESISWLVAKVVGEPMVNDKYYGIKVGGCGMDMGFDLVYRLGRYLWEGGFAPSEIGIRPIDHKEVNVNIGRGHNAGPMTKAEMEELAAKGWKFPRGRNGDTSGWDNDGGYALTQEWL